MTAHTVDNSQTIKLVEAARQLLKTFGYFVDNLWHVDDVHFICEQHELPKISDEEAMEVFVIANQHFDGETGISWPQLEAALHMYLKRKTLLSAPCERAAVSSPDIIPSSPGFACKS